MAKKTIFFDIDGTLLGKRDGRRFQMPESTREALRLLVRGGHRIAVCSGRQEAFIHKFFPGVFRSYVAMNGTHVVFEGKTVYDRVFPAERVAELSDYFARGNCRFVFIGKEHGWARNVPEKFVPFLNGCYGLPDFLRTRWEPEQIRANMMDFVFPTDAEYERSRELFTGGMVINRHPGGLTSDLSFEGEDKATGIERFLSYSGIKKEDTVAFGDGYNDVTMMGAVGLGVAMGNAVDEVKKAAGHVTSDMFDDGIYNGLRDLKLI